MSERRSIDPVDNMWLNMDRPNNLMVIDGVMWFDETIDFDRLAPLLQRRLIDLYPVFSQRPVAPSIPFGPSHWEDDPDFDLSHHLRRVTLPELGSQEDLQRYVESRMGVPFDHARPLWEVTLVEGFGSGCAVLSRFHHCLADGMALAQVILSLTNATAEADLEEIEEIEWAPRQAGGLLGAARLLVDTGAQTVQGGRQALSMLPGLATPSLPKDLLELGWKTGGVTTDVFAFTSLLTIPVFNPTWVYVISITAAFFTAMTLVLISDYRTPEQKADEADERAQADADLAAELTRTTAASTVRTTFLPGSRLSRAASSVSENTVTS